MGKKLRIEYKVVADAAALAAEAAERFTQTAEKALAQRGRVRMAISGGSTPKAAFGLLADPGQPMAEANAVGQAGPVLGR